MAKRCPLLRYCAVHDFSHGAEAEQLREKLTLLVETLDERRDESIDADMVALDLRQILDDVDARDSLAYTEFKKKERKSVIPKTKRGIWWKKESHLATRKITEKKSTRKARKIIVKKPARRT